MFTRPTVFILGAGASLEAGFPLGSKLISNMMYTIAAAIEDAGSQGNVYFHDRPVKAETLRRVYDGLKHNQSIDNYLSSVPDEPEIQQFGKYLIAAQILDAERQSHCGNSDGILYGPMNHEAGMLNSWYEEMFRRMRERTNTTNVHTMFENVAFVNFNYDRSLALYLLYALKASYPNVQDIEAIINKHLLMIHPYGHLGNLPFQSKDGHAVNYGCKYSNPNELIGNIYTFEEDISSLSNNHRRIHQFLQWAERIVFLGFAFHQQNLDLLFNAGSHLKKCQSILFTSKGISNMDVTSLKTYFANRCELGSVEISSDGCTCSEFFSRYRISLSN